MGKHNNLYYIFLEDQQKNPLRSEAKEKIQKNIENYYREIKPPWKANPPNSIKDEGFESGENNKYFSKK